MRFLAAAGLVMILSGLGAYYATEPHKLSAFSLVNIVAGPLVLALAGLAEARRLRGFSGRRSRAVALRWSGIGVALVAVAIAVNVLASRWGASIDLTVERSYTLAEQTRQLCGQLAERDGQMRPSLLFFEDARLWKEIAPLQRAYVDACPELEIRRLETADAPPEARALLARSEFTVLACEGGRCEPVGFPSEENITNALLRLGQEHHTRAYFLLGHGEVDLGDEGNDGYSALISVLQAEGIELLGWIGPAREDVPPDANLVIVAGASRAFLAPELDALQRYLEGGGRLLALVEAGVHTNLEELLERWGFELPDGVLVDEATSPLLDEPRPVSLIVNGFTPLHAVTRNLGRRTMLLMPTARPVLVTRKPAPDDELRELLFTSPRAWLERDVAAAIADRSIRPDPEEPGGHEISIGAAGSYPRGEHLARIVVFGDQDFVSNRLIGALYNRDLFMNAVLWLVQSEERIALRPKLWTPDQYPIALQETLTYFYFLAFALPEGLLLLGIAAWYRQRG